MRERIAQARVDALTMNQESLAELLVRKRWYNPFPKFKFTERPDAAAAQILEGDVVVLVDNSPAAIILPTTLFDVMEEANDYYFPPITGSYLRLVRFFTTFLTTFLTPVWLLLIQEPERVPGWLEFILMEEPAQVPPLLQLLILELAIDGLKLAALNTPNILTTSFSMIGAIILGDFAVQSGWFSAEVMLYMAVVAIANYNQPNLELGYALKFMRLILLVATGLLGLWGFVGGAALLFLVLVSNRTISGQCYLYPLVPFNGGELKKKLLRIGSGPPERKAPDSREEPHASLLEEKVGPVGPLCHRGPTGPFVRMGEGLGSAQDISRSRVQRFAMLLRRAARRGSTAEGATLSSSMPMARKVGSRSGSAPSSPQIPIQMPASWAASAAIFRARSTAGW